MQARVIYETHLSGVYKNMVLFKGSGKSMSLPAGLLEVQRAVCQFVMTAIFLKLGRQEFGKKLHKYISSSSARHMYITLQGWQ